MACPTRNTWFGGSTLTAKGTGGTVMGAAWAVFGSATAVARTAAQAMSRRFPDRIELLSFIWFSFRFGTGLVSWRVRGPREPFSGGPSAGNRFADPALRPARLVYGDLLTNSGRSRPPHLFPRLRDRRAE